MVIDHKHLSIAYEYLLRSVVAASACAGGGGCKVLLAENEARVRVTDRGHLGICQNTVVTEVPDEQSTIWRYSGVSERVSQGICASCAVQVGIGPREIGLPDHDLSGLEVVECQWCHLICFIDRENRIARHIARINSQRLGGAAIPAAANGCQGQGVVGVGGGGPDAAIGFTGQRAAQQKTGDVHGFAEHQDEGISEIQR